MKAYHKVALVGTAKLSVLPMEGEAELLSLFGQLPSTDTEEKLLLQAGVESLYHQSGWLPLTDVPAITPAPVGGKELRSPKLIPLLVHVIQNNSQELLLEFLQTLEQYQLTLPAEVLPMALSITDPKLRKSLMPVLGERGRWLSSFNPRWAWVGEGIASVTDQDRTALRRAWDEGKKTQRALALSVIRQADSAEGRRWLEGTLPQEKADARAELVEQLQQGLSVDDEPLLEKLLDDRSEQVKQVAAALLRQLPASAWMQRMQERASAMLTLNKNKLTCEPPNDLPSDWQRDGISTKPPHGKGKKAYWVEALLSNVPLHHWAKHFSLDPVKLLSAIKDDDYVEDVLIGWSRSLETQSASTAETLQWAHALWGYWLGHWQSDKKKKPETLSRMVAILQKLPAGTAEQNVLPFLVQGRLHTDALALLLDALPRPWSSNFAQHYLKLARQIVKATMVDEAYEWLKTLDIASRALPRAAFAAGLAPWDLERTGPSNWTVSAIEQLVDRFLQQLRLRQHFFEEVGK